MATQDEQKGRWETAGGNTNPRMGQEAVRGLRFPRLQGIWQRRDTGCDLAGFLIIFIKKCNFELFTWQYCAFRNKDKQQRHPDRLAQHIHWSRPRDSLGVHGCFSQLSLPEELSKKLSNSLGPEYYDYTSFKSNNSVIKCTQFEYMFQYFLMRFCTCIDRWHDNQDTEYFSLP